MKPVDTYAQAHTNTLRISRAAHCKTTLLRCHFCCCCCFCLYFLFTCVWYVYDCQCVCVCVFVDYKTVFRVHLKYYTRKTEFQFYALFNANCVFVCVCVFVDLVFENLNNGSSLKHTYLFCTLRFYFLIIATLFFACVYLLSLFLSIAWVRCGGFVLCLSICICLTVRLSVCFTFFFVVVWLYSSISFAFVFLALRFLLFWPQNYYALLWLKMET